MLPALVHLGGGDLLQDAVVEGEVEVEGDAVEPLQAEDELVKQQLGLLHGHSEWLQCLYCLLS